MTQENKELLLKDICARLPYVLKVNVHVIGSSYNEDRDLKPEIAVSLLGNDDICIKPYLRPMSSMTEEEMNELNKRFYNIGYFFTQEPPYDYGLMVQHSDIGSIIVSEFSEVYNWLNAHHFDYRGLIEKGLVLEAPEDMYK